MESNLAIRAETASDEPFIFYHYQVSMPAAIIFVVLFGLATALHLFQMFRSRTWFMVPFVIGAGFEVAGYVGRILNATENPGPYTLIPYIIQSIFLLVAPALLAASIYMELGRIVMMVQGEDCLFIRRTRLTKTFVVGDIIAFMLQAAGGGLQASKKAKTVSFSKKILLIGLFAQLLFFAIFVVAAGSFQYRFQHRPTAVSTKRPWKKHMLSLYMVSILIFVRSAVRVVEYIQGNDGYIISHEVFLYVFDAAAMFMAVVIMNWIHPGEVAHFVRQMTGCGKDGKGEHMLLDDVSV